VSVVHLNDRPWPISRHCQRRDQLKGTRWDAGAEIPATRRTNSLAHLQKPDAQPHQPLMRIGFVSSHTVDPPLPNEVPWDSIGDGAIYDPQPAQEAGAGSGRAHSRCSSSTANPVGIR
jgi:hypothetical protein